MSAKRRGSKLSESQRDERARPPVQCACVWANVRCPNAATQEERLCDWCGQRRADDLRDNPNAMWDLIDGQFLGLGGRGEQHIDSSRSPDACWMPNSGATR